MAKVDNNLMMEDYMKVILLMV